MATRMIQYIGRKPEKRDTVLGTQRRWKRGDAIPVPEADAAAYARHPDVFEDVTDKMKNGKPPQLPEIRPTRPDNAQPTHEEATIQKLEATIADQQAKIDALNGRNDTLERDNAELREKLGTPAGANDGPDDPEERQQAIITAIGELDRDADFTAEDKPKAGAIGDKLGWKVSGDERDAAWSAIQEAASQ